MLLPCHLCLPGRRSWQVEFGDGHQGTPHWALRILLLQTRIQPRAGRWSFCVIKVTGVFTPVLTCSYKIHTVVDCHLGEVMLCKVTMNTELAAMAPLLLGGI